MQRAKMVVEHQLDLPKGTLSKRVDPDLQKEIKKRAVINLMFLNSGIILTSFALGYILAGKTLRPIEQAMEKQKNFIANASHELKTPLTTIKLENEVVLSNKKANLKTLKKVLRSNIEEVDKLENLINKIIKQNKLESRQSSNFNTVKNKTLIKNAVNQIGKKAKAKNISIIKKVEVKEFKANEELLTELLVILLDNAIKYSNDNGKVLIESNVEKNQVIFKVTDFGKGIEKEDTQKIFDRFYTKEKSRSKNIEPGFGLGLSIAKEIAELHKGKIEVTSKLNKKTTFTVKLPA
jgi:signal transduction histidine kinase